MEHTYDRRAFTPATCVGMRINRQRQAVDQTKAPTPTPGQAKGRPASAALYMSESIRIGLRNFFEIVRVFRAERWRGWHEKELPWF